MDDDAVELYGGGLMVRDDDGSLISHSHVVRGVLASLCACAMSPLPPLPQPSPPSAPPSAPPRRQEPHYL